MPQQMIWFFVSIAFSLIAWGIVTARYIWPELRLRPRAEALRPLLILHSFRFIGLAFLVPGVVSPDLPPAFAHSAAYGDVIAAMLALLALVSLPRAAGVVIAWGIVSARYIWQELRLRPRAEALRPLLILHSFRFIGLAFLVPGVVSPDLPPAFAHSAAYGDIGAAMLALLALISLSNGAGIAIAWIFNLWGLADLLNAF